MSWESYQTLIGFLGSGEESYRALLDYVGAFFFFLKTFNPGESSLEYAYNGLFLKFRIVSNFS